MRGAPQIAANTRFTGHVCRDVWIQLAALCASDHVPACARGAHLTGGQTSLVLAMGRASHR